MALSPGGGRSPSTQSAPPPSPAEPPRPRPSGRKPLWSPSATRAVLRLGVLIGGLVIIADLSTQAVIQRTPGADDALVFAAIDEIVNYVLYSLLGVLVVRQTGLMYAGLPAGLLASLLDAIVVAAAGLMAQPVLPLADVEMGFARNLIIGILFAGLSGLVFAVAQRWSGGRRSR